MEQVQNTLIRRVLNRIGKECYWRFSLRNDLLENIMPWYFGRLQSLLLSTKPVVSCISFGLGNQLLQFAAGYGLAKHLRCRLALDLTWYDKEHTWTTARSPLITEIVNMGSFKNLSRYTLWNRLRTRALRLVKPSIKGPYRHGVPIWDRATHSSCPLRSQSSPVCITGVPDLADLPSEYLDEILEIISTGLAKAAEVNKPSNRYAFVHARFGDFESNRDVKERMLQLSEQCYQDAMSIYEEQHGQVNWILFSDEPLKALKKMPSGFSIVTSHGTSEIDDLFLMSRSSGGVVANSSFSMWGGLLAESNGGNVVAPAIWNTEGFGAPGLPDSWIRV